MTKQELSDTLRSRGICPTQQRVAVYEYLLRHRTHPTADTMYRALLADHPSLSRTTVYNTARALSKAGLIRTITIDADEQRFDAEMGQHGHFRCTGCGAVYDFPLSEQTVSLLTDSPYGADTLEVYTTGVCPHCKP
ncbi:MAG: transcriptional repressor [Clostridia bacterium]|nr:transcriptional repressor [Clostridia bacterium]